MSEFIMINNILIIRYFAVVSNAEDVGKDTYLMRATDQLPVSMVYLPKSSNFSVSKK